MWSVKNAVAVCILALSVMGLAGCADAPQGLKDIGRGASAGAMEAGKDAMRERLAELAKSGKLSPEDVALLAAGAESVPVPQPDPVGNSVLYGLAFLVAKLLGDAAKGLGRSYLDKRKK